MRTPPEKTKLLHPQAAGSKERKVVIWPRWQTKTATNLRLVNQQWRNCKTRGPLFFLPMGRAKLFKRLRERHKSKLMPFAVPKNLYKKTEPHRFSYLKLLALVFDNNNTWCIDVAYVDEIALRNDGVWYLLPCVDELSSFWKSSLLKSKFRHRRRNCPRRHAKQELCEWGSTRQPPPDKFWTDQGCEIQGKIREIYINSNFTSNKHSKKPRPQKQNAEFDRSRHNMFDIWKKSGCGVTMNNFKTFSRDSTT